MKHLSIKPAKYAAHKVCGERSGFTLIELIVAMAVSTIVMGAIIGIYVLTYRSYDEGHMRADAQNLAVLTLQKVKDAVRYEGKVTIYDNKTVLAGSMDTDPSIYFDSASGNIKIGGSTYLNGSFKNYDCVLTFTNDNSGSNNLLGIKITITNKSGTKETLFSTKGSVYLLNSGIITDNSTDKKGGTAITFS